MYVTNDFQLSVNKAFQNHSSAFARIAKLELSPIFAESHILYCCKLQKSFRENTSYL